MHKENWKFKHFGKIPNRRGGWGIIASSHGGGRNWNWNWNATSLLMIPALSLKKHPHATLNWKLMTRLFLSFAICPKIETFPVKKYQFLRHSCTLAKEMCANWFCGWPIVGRLDLALVTTRDWGWGRLGGCCSPWRSRHNNLQQLQIPPATDSPKL